MRMGATDNNNNNNFFSSGAYIAQSTTHCLGDRHRLALRTRLCKWMRINIECLIKSYFVWNSCMKYSIARKIMKQKKYFSFESTARQEINIYFFNFRNGGVE